MTPFNPDSWMDVFVLLSLAIIAAVPSWAALRNHRSLQQVKDQVVNGHKTQMRADMDAMRDELGGMRDEMRGGFAALRADLAEERSARRDGDMSLCEEIHDRHPAVTQERTARQAGDQTLRDDLTAHRDDTAAHETR